MCESQQIKSANYTSVMVQPLNKMKNSKYTMVKKYSPKQLLRLIRRVQKQIPESDTLSHRQRQMAIDWNEVAFGPMDRKECQRLSLLLVHRVQRLQTLPGLLETAKEAIIKMKEVNRAKQKKSGASTMSKEIGRAYRSYLRIKLKGVPVDQRNNVRINLKTEWEAMSPDAKLSYLPKKREKKNDGPPSPPRTLYNFFINNYIKTLSPSNDKKQNQRQAVVAWRKLSKEEKAEQKRLWEKAKRRHAKLYQAFLESLSPEEKEAKLQMINGPGTDKEKSRRPIIMTEDEKEYLAQENKIKELIRTRPPKPTSTLYHYFIKSFIKAKAGDVPSNTMFKAASEAWKDITEEERVKLQRQREKVEQRFMRMYAAYLVALHEEKEKLAQLKNLVQDNTVSSRMEPVDKSFDRLDDASDFPQGDIDDPKMETIDKDYDRLDDTSNFKMEFDGQVDSAADLAFGDVSPKKKKRRKSHPAKEYDLEKSDSVQTEVDWQVNNPADLAPGDVSPFKMEFDGQVDSAADLAFGDVSPKKKKRRKSHHAKEYDLDKSDGVQTEVDWQVNNPADYAPGDVSPLKIEFGGQVDSAADLAFGDVSPKKKKRRKSHHAKEYNSEKSDGVQTEVDWQVNNPADLAPGDVSPKKKRRKSHHAKEYELENNDGLQIELDGQADHLAFGDISRKKKKSRKNRHAEEKNSENADSLKTGVDGGVADLALGGVSPKKPRRKSHHEEVYELENRESLQTKVDGQVNVMADLAFGDISPVRTEPNVHTETFSASPTKAKKKKRSEDETNQWHSIENDTSYNEGNENHTPLEAFVEPPSVETEPKGHASPTKAKKKKRLEEETNQWDTIENDPSYKEGDENHTPLEAPVEPPSTKAKKKKRLGEVWQRLETNQWDTIENDPSHNEGDENHTPLEAPVEPPRTPMRLFLMNNSEMTEQDWTELPENKKRRYQKATKRLQQDFMVKYEAYLEALPRENLAKHVFRKRNDS